MIITLYVENVFLKSSLPRSEVNVIVPILHIEEKNFREVKF